MAETSDERALAQRLARLEPGRLAQLLAARAVAPGVGWRDCFDAAEALLDPASVDQALRLVPRAELRALDASAGASVSGQARDRLDGLALLDDDGRPFRVVGERLRLALSAHPSAVADVPPEEGPPPADENAAAATAERAVAAVRALTDVVAACGDQPLTVTGAGAITAVDRRRLIDTHVVADADELDDLVQLGDDARLIALVDREWRLTDAGDSWLPLPGAQRWTTVALAWRDALPAVLRTAPGGYQAPSDWDAVLPLDERWPERARALLLPGVRWGLYAENGMEPAWTTPLRAGDEPAAEALAALVPAEIDRIYLQADLTAIAPGPLRSVLDLRLRTMARRESRAQASTYRFTAETLAAAVAGGEDAASLRAFLGQLSLTGIPQPLDYLIEQTASRHGLVRVATDAATGRTRITSPDPQLLQTIAVDQTLRAIGLVRGDGELTSRVSRDAVFWTLADARYPVVALDAAGEPEPLRRRRPPVAPQRRADGAESLLPLATQLLAHDGGDTESAWLERELDQAVRARSEVVVTVRLPDGTEREFTMEVTGFAGGRLRGRDRSADIERTLPVSSIVGVKPR